ncbi:MAG: RNA polymerase sigma factor, partial [Planctomycetota bacterium]
MTGAGQPSGPDWLGAVLGRFEKPLVGYALRLVGDAEAARDVVQEAFLALCRRPLEPADPRLGPWLFRTCRHRAIDHLRKERRMQRLDASFAPPDAAAPPAEAAARREEAGRLLSVLRDLPPRQQEVVWLRFRGGLTYREIAEVCRISVNNVGVMLH